MRSVYVRVVFVSVCLLGLTRGVTAYPGGTPNYVTDVAPFCASCHSSISADQMIGVPPARVQGQLVASKHIAKIRAAREGSAYASLTEAQREALIRGIEQIDAAASVKLLAPEKLKVGQVFEVTVEATGGGGPVVGIALVDSNQRWQARPAPSAGWRVLDKPRVVGPDGNLQTKFTDRRQSTLSPGVAYVNIEGVSADTLQGRYSRVSVTLRLRAPRESGSYPLGAVFLYGTEKGSPHGAVDTLRGKAPLGGGGAASGRILFSTIQQIQVE